MRLTLVIPSLQRGGAERVMSLLAGLWAEAGHRVTLVTLNREGPPAYFLHPSVRLRNLGLPPEPAGNFIQAGFRQLARIRALRMAIRESKPDAVLSFLERTNVLTLIATRAMHIPVVVSERADPSLHDIGRLWRFLRWATYPMATRLVCQTISTLARFQKSIKVSGSVIPNPVVPPAETITQASEQGKTEFRLVALGRLALEKGYDLLLEAYALIAGLHPDWSLTIIGDGPLRSELCGQAKALKIADRVHFAGELSDPFPVLRSADLFVLSSRFEGFPNALCEAMARGLPVISFDCCAGPADIIRNGVDGILVSPQNIAEMAAVLDRLMTDADERMRLAARAPEVLTRFSVDKILLLWEQIFEKLCQEQRYR